MTKQYDIDNKADNKSDNNDNNYIIISIEFPDIPTS